MSIKVVAGLVMGLMVLANASMSSALTIDTSSSWTGSTNYGWGGSGQSLKVDAVENRFDNIGFYFDAESYGRTFSFVLSDALNGGNTLFSTSFQVSSTNDGFTVINIGRELAPNTEVYALIDYNGFTGGTVQFESDVYSGGNSSFKSTSGPGSPSTTFTEYDHRFVANFSEAGAPVPEPSTVFLLGGGLAGLAFARRRKQK